MREGAMVGGARGARTADLNTARETFLNHARALASLLWITYICVVISDRRNLRPQLS